MRDRLRGLGVLTGRNPAVLPGCGEQVAYKSEFLRCNLTVSGTMTGIEGGAMSLRCLTSTHYLSSAMMAR
jgi:hypothetical protein